MFPSVKASAATEVRGKRPVDPEELLARKNSMAIESPGH